MMKTIQTKQAPSSIGPYSQAVLVNGFLFCSGQIGIDPKTQELLSGIENQTRQVLKNLKAVLQEAGLKKENVVKTTIYITNIKDFPKVNEIYAEFFRSHKPARATIEVSNLPKGAIIEIEAIASAKREY